MRLYDTHAHFSGTPLEVECTLRRAREAGLVRVMAVGGSIDLNAGALAAAMAFPDFVRVALGFDRDQAGEMDPESCSETLERLQARVPLACIGEIGLDYHYAPQTRDEQCALFSAQLRYADEKRLPVSIHTRDADADTLRVLDETPWRGGIRGVIHCFTGSASFAKALLDRGFFISFSGIATFRNADALREVARMIPADRMLIETDSPYLAPVPKRGNPNEPAFVRYVADLLAQVRGVDVETLTEQTTENAISLFG